MSSHRSLFRIFKARLCLPKFRVAGMLAGLLLCLPLGAEEGDVFHVRAANFSLDKTMLLLNAVFEINLPSYINVAVDQGFAVPLMFEVEVLADKKYWLDEKVVSLKQKYLLHYLPMLNAYVLVDVNIGQRHYFDSREQAVSSLLAVYRYPMLDIKNFHPGLRLYARLHFGIDTDELPRPLKSSSLWDNDWGLQSDWFEWGIDQNQ